MIAQLLFEHYGLVAQKIVRCSGGVGSQAYTIFCEDKKAVLKFPYESEMNHPQAEPALCACLLKKGIPACRFIPNKEGRVICADQRGRMFHLQEFIEGQTVPLNTAPDWLMTQSAQLLGKIHTALDAYPRLPAGIGEDFFAHMTPQRALSSYEATLATARQRGDWEIVRDLIWRIDLVKRLPAPSFDLQKLSCKNTHGDYFLDQLLCARQSIRAVVDWTAACVHPAVWEIMRSFVYAAPDCKEGEIVPSQLLDYVGAYLEFSTLNRCDLEALPTLFFYQIAVCDYYSQFYASRAQNRDIFLHQALFSTKLLRWLDKSARDLSSALLSRFAR